MIFRSLALALGERRALELALTGRMFGANEALQYGLIHAVSIPIELEDRVQSILQVLTGASPEVLRRSLDFVHQTRDVGWKEAGLLAQQVRTGWFAHPDFLEGQAAAAENRKPKWPSLQGKGAPMEEGK